MTHPAANVSPQLGQASFHRDAPATAGDLANAVLELADGLRRYVDRRTRFHEREAEELELLARHHAALLLVHHQAKRVGQVAGNRCHDPLGSSWRLRKDRTPSSPGKSHPQALTEPDVSLSAHPALIVQSQVGFHVTIT